jgi:subtilisin family serine protease
LHYAREHGVLTVWAASNTGMPSIAPDGLVTFPGTWAHELGHLAIGAISYDDFDRPIEYSTHGPGPSITAIGHKNWNRFNRTENEPHVPAGWDVGWSRYASPGVIQHEYAGFTGTSTATPLVSGVAALVWSILDPGGTAPVAAQTNLKVRSILLATADKAQNPEFYRRFTRPALEVASGFDLLPHPPIGVANAARAVLKALTLLPANAGRVYPYLNFFGRGVRLRVVNGVATTHLRGTVRVEVDGFSSDPITRYQLLAVEAGQPDVVLYDGAQAKTTWTELLDVAAARLVGKRLKVIVSTANATAETEFTDIVAYATSASAPTTRHVVDGGTITVSAVSENGPVYIFYRWDAGSWQRYSGPFPARSGSLSYYGKDALGAVEGGRDYYAEQGG